MKKNYIGSAIAAIALMLGAAGSANAFTITAGNIKFTIDNYDSGTTGYGDTVGTKCTTVAGCDTYIASNGGTPAPGAAGAYAGVDTMGIFSVFGITNTTTGKVLFTKGVDGYLTGVFGNLYDTNVSVVLDATKNNAPTTIANATGGTFSLYQNALDYDPTFGPNVVPGIKDLNAGLYPSITDTGSLYLKGIFVPGAVNGDAVTTYQSVFANQGFSGNGSGFVDLTGGSALSIFNNNSYGGNRDLFLTTTFDDINRTAASIGWTVLSVGQAQGAAIPEPGSIALLGMGALVAGLAGRRRKQAK
jgi:hypothetical protein